MIDLILLEICALCSHFCECVRFPQNNEHDMSFLRCKLKVDVCLVHECVCIEVTLIQNTFILNDWVLFYKLKHCAFLKEEFNILC